MVLRKQVASMWFLGWASTKGADFAPQSSEINLPVHGWAALGRLHVVSSVVCALDKLVVRFHVLLATLHRSVKIFVAIDRVEYLWSMAWCATNAMSKQQSSEAFKQSSTPWLLLPEDIEGC